MNITNEQIKKVMEETNLTAIEAVTFLICMDIKKRREQGEIVDVKKLHIQAIPAQQGE